MFVFTYKCIWICVYICTDIYMYTYRHMHMYTVYMYIHTKNAENRECRHIYIYTYIYTYIDILEYTYIYIYVNVFVCICIYMYIYIYVHAYTYTSTGRWSTKMSKKLAKLHWRNFFNFFVTHPFYLSNRRERWISQPVSPDRKVLWITSISNTTFRDLYYLRQIQYVWLYWSNIYISTWGIVNLRSVLGEETQ